MESEEVKLSRGRFEDSVTEAVEKFTESISFDKGLYKHDIMRNRAHASMLAHKGLITEDEKNSILKGGDELEGKIETGEIVWRTVTEDVHMNIVAALTDLIGEPEKKLQTTRSRNDQVCTDFRLCCSHAIDNFVMCVKHLQVALIKLKDEGLRLIVPGYTHLQRAQPVSLQHLSLAYVKQGLITEDDKNSILKGLDEIWGQIERGEFVLRTDREDACMNIKAAVTDLVGEPEKKLHTARSRNDQLCTDFRLWCGHAFDNIVMCVKHLQVALVKLVLRDEELRLIVPGYTHLQRAQHVSLQHLFLTYVKQLARNACRLLVYRVRMNFCPLGACALAGTGLPMDRRLTSEALGFITPERNRRNKDNHEGSDGGGNGRWIRTIAGVGVVIGGVVGLYLVYKTGQAIEREIVGAVRDWKEAGFPALVKIQIEKVSLKFSIY